MRQQALPVRRKPPRPQRPQETALSWAGCAYKVLITSSLLPGAAGPQVKVLFGTGSPSQEGRPHITEPLGQPLSPAPDPMQEVKIRCWVWRGRENQHRAPRLKFKGAGAIFLDGGSQGPVLWMTCLNKPMPRTLGL